MLAFFPAVQKNLQPTVQVAMGFLTRPVTADQTHYNPGNDEYREYYYDRLHHISVPFSLPSMMLIAIAEMNTPASMYTKSI